MSKISNKPRQSPILNKKLKIAELENSTLNHFKHNFNFKH